MLDIKPVGVVGVAGAVKIAPAVERAVVTNSGLNEIAGER